jgi:hypothetical protein
MAWTSKGYLPETVEFGGLADSKSVKTLQNTE